MNERKARSAGSQISGIFNHRLRRRPHRTEELKTKEMKNLGGRRMRRALVLAVVGMALFGISQPVDAQATTGSLPANIFPVESQPYGATGAGVIAGGCSIAAGQTMLTCAQGSFPSQAVKGSIGYFVGAGTGEGSPTLFFTITNWISTSEVKLNTAAGTTVAGGGTVKYGPNDTTAITHAITDACSAGGGQVFFAPNHIYMTYPATFNKDGTYGLSVPCNHVSLASVAPGATIEANGAAQIIGNTCVRGRGIVFNVAKNAVDDSLLWMTVDGNTSGDTFNPNMAAPATGCDGWDISNQGVVLGGNTQNVLLDHDTIANFKGESVYGGSYTDSTLTIRNSHIGNTNGDALSVQAAILLVENNDLHDAFNNAAENPLPAKPGAVNTYRFNYVHDCSEGLNMIGTGLEPPGALTNVDSNTFERIGTGKNTKGYRAAIVMSSQFTNGVQGVGSYTLEHNKYSDVAIGVNLSGDGTPFGVSDVSMTDEHFVANMLNGGTPVLFGGGPYSNIKIDGMKISRTPYATANKIRWDAPFLFAPAVYVNVVIVNSMFDGSALAFSSLWAPNSVGNWNWQWQAPGTAPLWKNTTCIACPQGLSQIGNGYAQTVTTSQPKIYPSLDQAYVTANGGTVAATVVGGRDLDGQEFEVTVSSGTVTFKSDANQVINLGGGAEGGTVTLIANHQAKFVYAGSLGKWVMVWFG
jgi:hypothetical protein